MSVITLVFFIMFSILLYMLFGGHAGGGEGVLGFFFLYSEHYSAGGVGEEQPAVRILPRGTRLRLLTLCIPQSHEKLEVSCLNVQ